MIGGLERFVEQLRDAGITVSPAEWIDAVRALERTGLASRELFRATLRCTLVKRQVQLELFDREFERFFAGPGRGGPGRGLRTPGGGGGRGKRGAATDPARPPAKPREDRAKKASPAAAEPGPPGRLRRIVVAADPALTELTDRPRAGERQGVDPVRRDLRRRMTPEQERELAAEVPRLVERIRSRPGRRRRRASRGALYLRGLFRENMAQGGVPFRLPRRRLRPRRSKIVLLIDVSWSTMRAAGLFLSIAGEFLRFGGNVRVLPFVDRWVDGTDAVEAATRAGGAEGLRRVFEAMPELNLAAPSDYGRAFHRLLRSPARPAGRDTILLVLGDGRNNRFDPQDWAFEELAGGCGAVLWLVPEALAEWGTGDSALGTYLPHADLAVEARDLQGLARGVSELLRRQ